MPEALPRSVERFNNQRLIADEICVRYSWRGNKYAGVLNRGGDPGNCLAVLLPGSGPQEADCVVGPNRFMLQIATGLARRGISSLRFGKAVIGVAGKAPETYEDEYLGPIRAMLKSASKVAAVSRFALIGHSLGGHVAPLIARKISGVTGVVLFNANFRGLVTVLSEQLADPEPALEVHIALLREMLERTIHAKTKQELESETERYLWNTRRYDPQQSLRRLSMPFLCIGCGRDAQVSQQEFQEWTTALERAGIATTNSYHDGLNHLAMPTKSTSSLSVLNKGSIDPSVMDRIANWIKAIHEESDAVAGSSQPSAE